MRRSSATRAAKSADGAALPPSGVERNGSAALTAKQRLFAAEYLANGLNATRAYLASHPNCRSQAAAAVEGHRTLRNPKVQRVIAAEQASRFARLKMDGDEAMALLAVIARADLVEAFDLETGAMLPAHQWPLTLRLAVKSFSIKRRSITLHDGLKACELIARAAGRLTPTSSRTSVFDHAAYLAGIAGAGPK
jgi:hypothetical protein